MAKNVSKEWWKSRTVWVGAVQVVAGLLLAFADYAGAGGALTLSGVATVLLRTITKTEVK